MKRPVFIIISIILVLLLVAVWVYVLFSGSPTNSDDLFANFGQGDTTDPSYQEPIINTPTEPVVDVTDNQRLRQLTTKPVAGFQEVQLSTSSPRMMQYMEVGTGHIFSINLETGEEKRISGTTIPAAHKAAFTPDGRFVMIQSGFGNQPEFTIGELNTSANTLSNRAIHEPVLSFSGTKDNRFLYAIQNNANVIGKVYDPANLTAETLFTLPFREATIEWGSAVTDTHYVYPKTTRQLESFLYGVKNGAISRLPVDGYGMSATGNDNYVLYSTQANEEYQSFIYDTGADTTVIAPKVHLPEKCVLSEDEYPVTICAITAFDHTATLPDSWYQGDVQSADNLWEFTPSTQSGRTLINTQAVSGRQLDIVNLSLGQQNSNVYFQNQSDNTLWVYERLLIDDNNN